MTRCLTCGGTELPCPCQLPTGYRITSGLYGGTGHGDERPCLYLQQFRETSRRWWQLRRTRQPHLGWVTVDSVDALFSDDQAYRHLVQTAQLRSQWGVGTGTWDITVGDSDT